MDEGHEVSAICARSKAHDSMTRYRKQDNAPSMCAGFDARPVVSLITGTYNAGDRIQTLLESLEKVESTPEIPWEVIIVDNNSTDDTPDVIQDYVSKSIVRIKFLRETKQGVSRARNKGIRHAKGEILAFVDQDCVLDPSWLLAVVREFRSCPELSMIGGRLELFDARDKPISIRTATDREAISITSGNLGAIPGCNMAVRRSVFDAVGLYDARLGPGAPVPIGEDIDLIYRIARKGFRIEYTPDVLVYHNHGRRTDAAYKATWKLYVIGKGVFFGKYILRGRVEVLKFAYWDLNAEVKSFIKGRKDKAAILNLVSYLYAVLIGFFLQMKDEILMLVTRARETD